MAGQVIKRAGITAVVVVGAIVAAGPAAAAAAAPAAHAATTARGGPSAAATSTPVSRAAARLSSPALRRFVPWGRATAAGASAAMTPQARMAAAAANAFGFSGAELVGVSCTGRSQCTATGLASTRSGKNLKTLAERWNGTTWAVQSTPTPTSRTLLGGTLTGGVSCTSSTACVADGFSYSKNSMRLLGEGWNGHTWTAQPDATPVVAGEIRPASPAGGPRTAWPWAAGYSGMTLAEHWNGRKWSAVTTKHDGELIGRGLPRHRELHGRRREHAAGRRSPRTGTGRPGRTSPWPARTRSTPCPACPAQR